MDIKDLYTREKHVVLYGQSAKFRLFKYIILFGIFGACYLWRGLEDTLLFLGILLIVSVCIHFFFRYMSEGWTKSWWLYKHSLKSMTPEEILTFWFKTCTPEQWFKKDPDFDETIRNRFLDVYWKVVNGETKEWRVTPEGRLAEIIVLDQFARNIFRDTPQAFANDPLALTLAEEAVESGDDLKLSEKQRRFVYMPYMHSEDRVVHEKALTLFNTLGGDVVEYEVKHKEIIDRFGRYPHRNKILGRASTPEEEGFVRVNKGF